MKKTFLIFIIVFAVGSCFGQLRIPKGEACKKASMKFYSGDREGGIKILDEAIAKNENAFDAYSMRGSFKSNMGNFQGAIDDYKAALALDPTDLDIYEKLALWQTFLRDYDGAVSTLDSAIAHGVKSERVYTQRGDIKRDQKDLAGAAADYQSAIAADAESGHAYIGLARVFEEKGDLTSAVAGLQTFLRNYEGRLIKDKSKVRATGKSEQYERPGNEADSSKDMLVKMGQVVFDGTPEEMEKKKAAFDKFQNIKSAYYYLGELFRMSGDIDQAMANYDKGIAMQKSDGYGRGLRAKARISKGDLTGAIEDLEVVLDDPMPWSDKNETRGILYILQGKDEDAGKEFAAYLQRFPRAKDALDKKIEEARALRMKRSS